MNPLEMLPVYLGYPFVQAALVVGVLVALCCSLFGVTLVLNHQSFLGDSLSHVAFGAMAVSGMLQLTNNLVLTLVLTVACSVVLMKQGSSGNAQGDSSLAMLSVGALALGYLLMNLFSNSANVAGPAHGFRLRSGFGHRKSRGRFHTLCFVDFMDLFRFGEEQV